MGYGKKKHKKLNKPHYTRGEETTEFDDKNIKAKSSDNNHNKNQDSNRDRSKNQDSNRDKSRSQDSNRDRSKNQDSNRDRSRSQDSNRDKSRSQDSNRDRSRSQDSNRDRSRSQDSNRDRSKSQDSNRDRSKSQDSNRNRSKSQDSNRNRSKSQDSNKRWSNNRNKNKPIDRSYASRHGKIDKSPMKISEEFIVNPSVYIMADGINERNEKREEQEKMGHPECPICGFTMKSSTTAIIHGKSGKLAHFDCVLKELNVQYKNKLGKNRRIHYIGNGNFAIAREHHNRKGKVRTYNIIEKIEYETKE